MSARHLLASLLAGIATFAAILLGLDRLGVPNVVVIFCALLGAILVGQAADRWLKRREGR